MLVIENCTIFDGYAAEVVPDSSIVIENGIIQSVAQGPPDFSGDVHRIDASGRFVMPGLIDAHFHSYGVELNPAMVDLMLPELRGLHAKKILEGALQRGFTTIRDAAGGDIALSMALAQGLIDGPRLYYPGLAVSQTGGHGDLRAPEHYDACACAYCGSMSVVVDGPHEMRKVVRDQLRTGATQIKIFVSGGVLSPTDPIWMDQLSIEEIQVAVEEASTRRAYVMAHAHTNDATIRCVENGVRTIEHATLVEDSGAKAIADADAFAVPTLAIIEAMRSSGANLGLPRQMIAKMEEVGDEAMYSYERLRNAKVKIGFGTDLFGALIHRQSSEFALRREISQPIEILRSATSINAQILQMEGKLGVIAPEAHADILILEKSPLDDIETLCDHDLIRAIIRDGRVCKNTLDF